LLTLALTHRSFANEAKTTGLFVANNERLEFLGDSVLGLVVTEELYRCFPDHEEGQLSPLRSGVVNMKALALLARELEIGKYVRIGKGEERSGGREKSSILADCLEALIGAMYLEHGFSVTSEIILKWTRPILQEAVDMGHGLDGKTALQDLAASMSLGNPEYSSVESGPDHDKSFVASVKVAGEVLASGDGKSKREAEQVAARAAYQLLSLRKIR
jgi:ribonuclease-3